MKRILLIYLVLVFMCQVTATFAQVAAKKPTIMVVPSDAWCIRNGFYSEVDIDGVKEKTMDYAKAFQENSDIRALVAKMGDIMAANQFPIKSLEEKMKDLATDAGYNALVTNKSGESIRETSIDMLNKSAKPDIILDLDFDVKRNGPRKQVSFNLTAVDAYSGAIISGNTGVSSNSSAPLTTLLEESVLSFMDNFINGLQRHFDDMFQYGRIIKVEMKIFDGYYDDFETEYEYNGMTAELGDIINVWFELNAVEGRYSEQSRSETQMIFEDVRMPMTGINPLSGRESAMDASKFISGLTKMLKDNYGIPVKRFIRGQGKVLLVLGEK